MFQNKHLFIIVGFLKIKMPSGFLNWKKNKFAKCSIVDLKLLSRINEDSICLGKVAGTDWFRNHKVMYVSCKNSNFKEAEMKNVQQELFNRDNNNILHDLDHAWNKRQIYCWKEVAHTS